jgi:hypothetical protein
MGSRPLYFLGDVDVLVVQMIHFVEKLPEEWRPKWEEMRKSAGRSWDDVPGKENALICSRAPSGCPRRSGLPRDNLDRMPGRSKLEEIFESRIKEESLQPLLPVIQGLMRFRPEDRISAEEALSRVREGSGGPCWCDEKMFPGSCYRRLPAPLGSTSTPPISMLTS